jgi:hypothetical protein
MKAGWLFAAALLALAGCGEKPQQGTSVRKADTPAYQGAQDPFVAPGWKVGDQASWQEQLRKRAQGQNEYLRIAGQ